MSGKKVEARKVGAPCKCGCFDKVTRPVIDIIHKDFWAMGDFVLQNAFIQKQAKREAVKRRRVQLDPNVAPKKEHTVEYTITHGDQTHNVCRTAFLSILGISRRRLQTALDNVGPSGTPKGEQRGQSKRNTKADEHRDRVKEHITSFPTVTSHYTRAKSPHMRYLDSNLNVALMHALYEEWMAEKYPNSDKMNLAFYRKIFNQDFRLSFKPPLTDTCSKCDEYNVSIANATKNKKDDDRDRYQALLKEHQDLAARGHRKMKEMAKNKNNDIAVVCIDLQQTLPIPRLPTSVAYYKMKLWMYNLAVTDLKTGKSTCFVWDEVNGGRGSCEVTNCIWKWLRKEWEHRQFKQLVVFSDNCGGQNKNINVVLNYLNEIHNGTLTNIDHYYLVPGHSYMACDRAFGVIEKRIRTRGILYNFEDYCKVIEMSNIKTPNTLWPLNRTDFLDSDVLQKHITHRKPQAPYSFSGARRFSFNANFPDGYFVGMDFDSPLSAVKLRRTAAQPFNLHLIPQGPKYPQLRPIQAAKVKHLQDLCAFIPSPQDAYLRDIITAQQQLQQLSVPDPQDADSDIDNDLLDYTN